MDARCSDLTDQMLAARDTPPTALNYDHDNESTPTAGRNKKKLIGAVVGGVLIGVAAVVAAPVVLGVVGYDAAGITAGSIASSSMAAAAIANGGGIAPGSIVAVFQSVGAAGLGVAGTTAVASAGAAVGAAMGATVADNFIVNVEADLHQ